MITQQWESSPRRYRMRVDEQVEVPVTAGFTLDATVFRPDADGRFPIILSPSPYDLSDQVAPLWPTAFSHRRGHMEAGDPSFYARRGYVHVLLNIRGSGRSGGAFDNLGSRTIDDVCDAIAWLRDQPWCDGNVGMFGASYFSLIATRVAARSPKGLKCIFAPFAWTDAYRDRYYHGGILNHGFTQAWFSTLPQITFGPGLESKWSPQRFDEALRAALDDIELNSVPFLRKVMADPSVGEHRPIIELLLQPFDDDYYRERSVDDEADSRVPAYFGACWGVYGNHLPGAFRSYERWAGPKKLTIGPPIYLDRPLYQYAHESLLWFDFWLKDVQNGIMDEPPISLFVEGSGGEWRGASQWPLPGTRWTPFFLHQGGLLSEHEFWDNESPSTFVDSPYERGELRFTTPAMVEATEICGPVALTFWGSTTCDEVLWFVSLLEVDAEGNERLLTRGWLRGSQRELDRQRSRPWQPYQTHLRRDSLTPGEIYRFDVEIRPYAIVLRPGRRLCVRIKCVDDETPATALEAIAMGHLHGPRHARVTLYHEDAYPSQILLPITRGNRIGTFISGGAQEPPG